jgi:hypothetical protein
MNTRNQLALCALIATLSTGAQAATVIESAAGPNRVPSLLTVQDGKAKLQSDPANYLLIDPAAGQFLYVVTEKKQVVDMNSLAPSGPPRAATMTLPPKIKLTHKGKGPKIAGYATQHYQLFANGALCLNTYLSPEAMKHGALQDFHDGFARMQTTQKQAQRTTGMRFSPCEDAQDTLAARYGELGLPMRTLDVNGTLRQEVVNIETGVTVAGNLYQLPEGYSRITHETFLRQMEGMGGGAQEPVKDKGSKS